MLVEVGFDKFVEIPLPNEKELLSIFQVDEELVIFDIGACEAEDSVRYVKLFPNAKVHTFEPVPSNYKIALNNIKKYKLSNSISLNNVALSDSNGEATFHLSSGTPTDIDVQPNWDYGNKSSSLLEPKKTLEVLPWLKFDNTITVKTVLLDDYCKNNNIDHIDIIHMDVQGAELMVLNGGKEILQKTQAIWMEVESIELYKGQPLKNKVEKFMKKNGFEKNIDTVDSIAGDQLYVRKKEQPKKSKSGLMSRIKKTIS